MKRKMLLKNEKGFTLIEIIAVLVILGILAAVAIPKFINLQKDSREKAQEGALAAGASQLAMAYASDLLGSRNSASANVWSYGTVTGIKMGDFTASITGACGTGSSSVTLTNGPWALETGTNIDTKTFTICND